MSGTEAKTTTICLHREKVTLQSYGTKKSVRKGVKRFTRTRITSRAKSQCGIWHDTVETQAWPGRGISVSRVPC